MNTSRKLAITQVVLLLTTLEGIVAFYFLISTKSMDRNAWLLSLSLPRLLLAAAMLGAITLLVWLSYKSLSDRGWSVKLASIVDRFTSKRQAVLLSILGLALVIIASLVLFTFRYSADLAEIPYVLLVAFDRITPVLVWVTLASFQTLVILSQPLLEGFRNNLKIQPERFRVVLLASSLIAACFHAVVLSLQLPVFDKIPDWFWNFRERRLDFHQLVFVVIFVLVMLVLQRVLQAPERRRRNVLMIVALGYAVQLGFGIAQGQGFESLRLKYVSSGTSTFSKNACGDIGAFESIRRYDELYGSGFWEGTKPPGLQALFSLFGDMLKAVNPGDSQEACFNKLTSIAAYIFPLLATLVAFPLLMIGDLLGLESRVSYLASILYVTLPSFTQFPLFHDQFLLPVVFMCAITLIIYAVQKKSFWLSTIAGISIYIATFISFSLLPLIGFAIVWLLMQWVSVRQSGSWLDFVKILAGIVVGVAFAALVCHLLLDYNPIARYQAAFAQHRTIKYFRDGLAQVWQALLINNLEYLTLLGLPLVITVIYQTLVSFLRLIGKQENQMDLFVVAVSVIYLGLNVLGQTRGEVGRIWLFLAPAVCLVGAFGLSSVYRSGRIPIFLIVGLQLAIALFVFQFQDYGCKFCP